jgi:hypothetical protein
MVEQGSIGTGFFQGVGEHSEAKRIKFAAGQHSMLVGGLGKAPDHGRQPGGGQVHGPTAVAEDVPQEAGLCR